MFDQALYLHQAGNLAAAEALYRRVVTAEPGHGDALHLLGVICAQTGRGDESRHWLERAVAANPDFAQAWCNLGNVLGELGHLPEAVTALDRAIALDPANDGMHRDRGRLLGMMGANREALESFDAALALKPQNLAALSDRGVVLMELGRPAEALASYDRALAIQPLAATYSNRGNALQELMRFDEALAAFERALALEPGRPDSLWNKALCLLSLGRLKEGLRLYEWRKRRPSWTGPAGFSCPEWTGAQNLNGKTLLVHAEQGLGDTIHFCRYVKQAEARGARVMLAVPDTMRRLLGPLGVALCDPDIRGPSDFRADLLSLPLALGTDWDGIPAETPYLFAEPEQVARWRGTIGEEGFRIGVCWQGRAGYNTARHLSPEHLAPLAKIPGVRLISLQKDAAPPAFIETLGEDFDSGPDAFVDSAAVMENLDLVISVDTAMAHLAGALGRPVWTALKYAPDWRWFLNRADSPWYPSMRLFRQNAPDHWDGVVEEMRLALVQMRA